MEYVLFNFKITLDKRIGKWYNKEKQHKVRIEWKRTMYAVSKTHYTSAKYSVDGKKHQKKLWYGESIDFGFGTCVVWGLKKDRKVFTKKADATKIANKHKANVVEL